MWKFIMSYKLPEFRVCITTRGFTSQNQGNQRPVSHCLSSSLACVHSSATAKKLWRRLCSSLADGASERIPSFVIGLPAIQIAVYYNHSLLHCNAIISVLFLRPLVSCSDVRV